MKTYVFLIHFKQGEETGIAQPMVEDSSVIDALNHAALNVYQDTGKTPIKAELLPVDFAEAETYFSVRAGVWFPNSVTKRTLSIFMETGQLELVEWEGAVKSP